MMKSVMARMCLVSGLGIVWMASGSSALAADRFVARAGNDAGNDCLSSLTPCATIAAAIGQAVSGDTIKVAFGVYRENLRLDGSTVLAIQGGWSGDFTARDPALTFTRVDGGGGLDAVFGVAAGAGESIDLTLDGLVVSRGYGSGGGGVSAATSADGVLALTVKDCVIERSVGAGLPSGMRVSSLPPGVLQLSITDSTFRRNQGGALYISGTVDALVVNTTFERNRNGSAVRGSLDGGSLTLMGCTMDRGTARNREPALHVVAAGPSTLTIDDCIFTSNRGGGGAVLGAIDGLLTAEVRNSVFRANRIRLATQVSGPTAGGIRASATFDGAVDLRLTNVTVAGNPGGGVSLATEGQPLTAVLTNTILWGNAAGSSLDLELGQNGGTLSVEADHNVLGERGGVGTFNDLGGNLDADPLLAGRLDAHLTAASPAVDAGTCTGAPATDFDGDPRPTGAGCDIGADELAP